MSGRTDLFSKYSQIYQKGHAREIVPEGPFVRQLTDVNRQGLDIGIFFKAKKRHLFKCTSVMKFLQK